MLHNIIVIVAVEREMEEEGQVSGTRRQKAGVGTVTDTKGKECQEMSVRNFGCYIWKSLVSSESTTSVNTELSNLELRLYVEKSKWAIAKWK